MTSLSIKNAAVATDSTFQEKLDKAIELHKEGNGGNISAIQEAYRLLEQLRHDHPGHPLADAYHGAVMNLIARYSTKTFERLKYSNRGLKLLDEAVAADPNNPKIRLLRGKVAYAVPEKHFHRTATAIEDYKFLIDHSMRENGALTEGDSKLVYELGEAYYRIGRNQDAANCWRKLENDPEYGQTAKQKLQSVAGRPAVEEVQSDGLGMSDFMGVIALATGKALLKWVKHEEKKARKKRKKKERRRRKRKH
ncbi:tetratricopeptide repeat protein [Paenibacillus hemerocallicola]|nr:hypothetical protein [Paenibacillus hemerocallicola]